MAEQIGGCAQLRQRVEGAAMRIVFMGTPDFAVPALDALVAAGHEVVAAYSQPPRAGGRRGKALTASPVQQRAEALGIPVHTPRTLRDPDIQAQFAAHEADVAVVAAYGLILPRSVLDAPRHGCLNIHASLLPRWRGAAPIQRAILAGDAETGVGIMQMDAGLDTGPVRAEARIAIGGKTAPEVTGELAEMGAELMVAVLADLAGHPAIAQPDAGVTLASKVDKAETRLDFLAAAPDVERQVRAFHPLAFFEHAGERVRVLAAEVRNAGVHVPPGTLLDDRLTIACGSGALRPIVVQRAGRGVMKATEMLRGFPIPPGARI